MDASLQGGILSDPCIALSTTHWLAGSGTNQPMLEMALPESYVGRIRAKRYVIEASGEAVSKSFARGLTELKLIYDGRMRRLTGSLNTLFFYGESLELSLDGDTQVRFEGQTMKLQAKITVAILRAGSSVYELDYGQIDFILPRTPEGQIEMHLSTNAMLCIR